MKEKNMVTGALILSAAALFVRVVGFVFRIFISNTMGAEGMGLYTLIMSVYGLCCTLATSGMSTAVSTLSAEQISLGKPANAKRVLKRASLLALVISSAVCAVVVIFAGPIGENILKDARTVNALRILAAGLPFLSVSACLRGYFIACRRVGNPAAGQIIEQLVKMTFIIYMIGKWLPRGLEYGCAVVVLGMTIGEIACFLYSFWGYIQARNKPKGGGKADIRNVTGKIMGIIVPLSITAYIRSFLHLAEDVLILAGLKTFSGRDDVATGLYGMLKGMVMPLLIFPLMLLSSFVITLTPEISRMNAVGNRLRLEQTVSKILGYTFVAGTLIVVIFMTFPAEIGLAVYKNAEVGALLGKLSFLCPFMCIEMVSVGILNGLGKQTSSMIYAISDSVIRIAIIYFMIPVSGVTGFMIMVITSNLLTSILNFIRLIREVRIKIRFNEWILRPVLAAAASNQAIKVIMNYIPNNLAPGLPGWVNLAIGLAAVCGVYIALLFSIGSIRLSDFTWIISRIKTSGKTPEISHETGM